MPTKGTTMSASTIKEKGKKTPKKGLNDYSCDPSELGESIDTLAEVELKMRLEAMDTFGKWLAATCILKIIGIVSRSRL